MSKKQMFADSANTFAQVLVGILALFISVWTAFFIAVETWSNGWFWGYAPLGIMFVFCPGVAAAVFFRTAFLADHPDETIPWLEE